MPLSSLAVAVMTKHPTPGKVKTRLTPDLTPEQAAAVHAVFLKHLTTRLTPLDSPDVPLVLLFTAAQLTEKSPVSLSPTADGGYWSIGLTRGVDVAALLSD